MKIFFKYSRYYAVCRPIDFQKKRLHQKPHIEIILSLFIGTALQIPNILYFDIKEVCCLGNFTIEDFDALYKTENECIWEGFRKEDLENYPLWMAYVVIHEFLVKIGPTFLLVGLNIAILREFNVSIQRKKFLRTPKFVKRHSSQLLFGKPKPNKLFKKSNFRTVQ